MPLWQVDIYPAENELDREGQRTGEEIQELGLGEDVRVVFAKGFLLEGELNDEQALTLADSLLGDSVVERKVVARVGDASLSTHPDGADEDVRLVHVMPKPGVMDPVAASTISAARDLGYEVDAVRTLRKYWIDGV
ncbi:MAG: phosphoribosylformylglycinamidine synthase, partial [Planctomycetota bacterium]